MSPLKRALAAVPDHDGPHLAAALAYAAAGFYVVPVRVTVTAGGRKDMRPIVTAWQNVATTDPETIRGWWTPGSPWAEASIAVAVGRSHLGVVDLDDGQAGEDEWTELRDAYGLKDGPSYRTPSGGRHLWYRADEGRTLPTKTRNLGDHIDTRGGWDDTGNGYVIVPPSVDARGGYQWIDDQPTDRGDIPELPAILCELARGGPRPRDTAPTAAPAPGKLKRAERPRTFTDREAAAFCRPYVDGLRDAPHGAINDALNTAAMVLGHFGPEFWPFDEAETALLGAQLRPEHDADDRAARATIRSGWNAGRSSWQAVRVEAAHPDVDGGQGDDEDQALDDGFDAEVAERAHRLRVDEAARRQVDADRLAAAPPIEDHLVWDDEFDDVEPPRMAIPRLLPECAVGWLGGPSGAYKSFVAVALATGLAYCCPVLDDPALTPRRARRVLYVAGEGYSGVVLRGRAVRRRLGLTRTRELAVYRRPFDLGSPADADRLIAFALANGIEFVVIDTWRQSTPGVEENDNTAVSLVLRRLLAARDDHGLNFLIVDHTTKSAAGLADLGGAGAKRANADYVLMVDLPGLSRDADQQRTLRVAKLKDSPDGHTWPIRLERVPDVVDAEGVPAAVAVIGAIGVSPFTDRDHSWWADEVPEDLAELFRGQAGRSAALDLARLLRHIDDGDGFTPTELKGQLAEGPRSYSGSTVKAGLKLLKDTAVVGPGSTPTRLALADRWSPATPLRSAS